MEIFQGAFRRLTIERLSQAASVQRIESAPNEQ